RSFTTFPPCPLCTSFPGGAPPAPHGRWSGPLLATNLVGSSLTPVIGATLVEVFGFQGVAIVLGIASFVLALPAVAVARLSTRLHSGSAIERALPRLYA
ncbi:hypothetical protein ACWKWP_17435, partial [Agromyces soli]